MKKGLSIEIFYFEAGAGHRCAMRALKEILALRHPRWIVTPIDLQKLLEPVDPLHKICSKISPSLNRLLNMNGAKSALRPLRAQDFYNLVVNSGVSRGFDRMRPLVQEGIRKRFPQIEALLKNRWLNAAQTPDLVISVIPNFNGVLFRALRAVCGAPFITVITDLEEREPGFWMEDQDQIIVCGSANAAKRARSCGFYAPRNIIRVSGMLLRPLFYNPPGRSLSLRTLGLLQNKTTALISFGGNGSIAAKTVVDRLEKAKTNIQCLVLCGKNKRLFEKLRQRKNCCAVGFVQNVADFMRLADFYIGKPGPGSLSEALHLGLPVVVESNAATLPQEKPNVDWVLENGVGLSVSKLGRHIAFAAAHMEKNLGGFKQNIRLTIPPNRALFEIADVIENVIF